MKYIILFTVLLFSSLLITSCSDLRDDVPVSAPKIFVHSDGIVNPSSPNFHGKLVLAKNWDMKQCQQCHSSNYSGGTAGTSCYNSGCHNTPGGPEACNTCHGDFANPLLIAPPRALSGAIMPDQRGVGAHTRHLRNNLVGKAVSCTECHIMPQGFSDPNHIDDIPGAEVIFGSFTKLETNVPGGFNYQPSLGTFSPNPSFDYPAGTCANTYCHGYFKNGNLDNIVSFTAQSQGSSCGSCHGNPTTGSPLPKTTAQGGIHPTREDCELCHSDVVAKQGNQYVIINKDKHINGKLNVFGDEQPF